MNYTVHYFTLDTEKSDAQAFLSVRQGETHRRIGISLVTDGRPYVFTDDCYATIAGVYPNGTVFSNPATIENGMIFYALTSNNTLTVGEVSCEARIYGHDSTLLVSPKFKFHVYSGSGVDSSTFDPTEINSLTLLISGATEAIDDCEEATEAAETATTAANTAASGANAATATANAAEAARATAEAGRVTAETAREASKIAGSTATIDSNVGIPSVTVTMTDHAGGGKDLNFEFKNLKGPAGSGAWGTIEGTLSDQTDLQTVLDSKVDKITGKGLSTEDYTTAEKSKLSGIEPGAEVNVQSNWSQSDSTADDYIKNKPTALSSFIDDLGSDPVHTHSQYLTQQSLADYRKKSDQDVIDSNKVDKVDGKGLSTEDYTTAEMNKLSGIEANANNYTLPVAGSALGGVKSGTDITVDSNGNVSVNDNSHNHTISNVNGLQTALNAKITNPAGGTAGQVLKKTASGEAWGNESPGGVWGQIEGTLSDQEDLNAELESQSSAISQHTSQITATQGMISDAWSASSVPYSAGSYAIDNNKLWKALTTNSVRPTQGSDWKEVSIGSELNKNEKFVKGKIPSTSGGLAYSDSTLFGNYVVVGYSVFYNGLYYFWCGSDSPFTSIRISNSGIVTTFSNNVIADKDIYFELRKISD